MSQWPSVRPSVQYMVQEHSSSSLREQLEINQDCVVPSEPKLFRLVLLFSNYFIKGSRMQPIDKSLQLLGTNKNATLTEIKNSYK